MPRARAVDSPPDGFLYRPEFLDPTEERALLARFDELAFEPIVMKGVVARRTGVRYGYGYDYDRREAIPGAEPIPDWLEPLRARAAELADAELVQALIQRYPPGAPIGWHRDSPSYEVVAGISFGGRARMRLRRGPADDRIAFEQPLEPRSAYVLAGEARWKWEHHVPPAKELRYSITFRSLRQRAQAPTDP
jgi:alkylated DNA repair dioxygenase AlkB